MRYAILGPLEVSDGDRRVDVGARKQRAVLAVLLLDTNTPVPLDRLLAELWGRERPERATATLQAYVSHLRRALEPDRPPGCGPKRLVSKAPGYVLVADDDDVDARRFEALAIEGRQLLARDPQSARRVLADALTVWRGPFLGEFTGEAFAEAEGARLGELRATALEDRIEADLALGAHTAVVAELDPLVRRSPLRERLWGLLMVALSRAGRQAEALRAFQDCRRTLNDELGLEPCPGLRQLEREVIEQRDELSWRWHPASPPLQPVTVAETATAPAADGAALVGRAAERAALDAARRDAWAGRGRAVLLAGEAGIGKTALAEDLAGRVGGGEVAVVAWGRCHEGEGAPAWWPWSQVLRQLSEEASSPGAWGPSTFDTTGWPDGLGARARFEWNQRATSALLDSAATRPCLVVLEDLQWADAASLALLSFLVPRLDGARLLVVATYRDTALEDRGLLADTLGELARHPSVCRLRPSRLAASEVGRLIAGLTGRPPSTEVAAEVRRRGDGNPFFVIELIRLLEAEGALAAGDPAEVDRVGVPDTLADVIRRRLARMPDQTRAFLRVAAVAGREFDLDAVEAVSGVNGDDALVQVELAVMRGVLQEGDGTGGHYRFVHDLVRQVLDDGLGTLRRARLHARLVEVLAAAACCRPGQATELAHHAAMALPAREIERGVSFGSTPPPGVHRASLATERWALFRRAIAVGEVGAAERVAAGLLAAGRQRSDPALAALGHWGLGTTELLGGHLAAAAGHLERTVVLADAGYGTACSGEDSCPAVGARCHLAGVRCLQGDMEAAAHLDGAAAGLARSGGRPAEVALVAVCRAGFAAARRDVEAAASVEVLAGPCVEAAVVAAAGGWAMAASGQPAAGADQAAAAVEILGGAGGGGWYAAALCWLAEAYSWAGRPGAALAAVERAIAHVDETGERWYGAEAMRLSGELLRSSDTLRAAALMARRQGAVEFEHRALVSLAQMGRDGPGNLASPCCLVGPAGSKVAASPLGQDVPSATMAGLRVPEVSGAVQHPGSARGSER